jgi:hypothetical protein
MKTMMRLFTMMMGLMLLSIVLVNAQNPVTPEAGVSLYKHTTNSADLIGPVAGEASDTVTTTSTLKYYVLPDAAVNPGFAVPFTNIVSTFTWTTSVPTGSAAGAIAAVPTAVHGNYRQVNWTGTGTINLNAVENSTSGCASGTTTTVPIVIIAIPTATGGAAPATQCTSNPATLTFAVPVTLTSDLATAGVANRVRVNYTVTNPDASVLLAATDVELNKGAVTFNVTLTGATQYGNYTVTINAVSDRISRKSVVTGTVATPNITLTVFHTPVTGPIYHIPNM